MLRAVTAFEQDFARWDLHLPADAIEARRGGQIRHAGWSIRYNFGRDAQGEYLDYYASPRDVHDDPPGDDWHVRLYASGERVVLPTVLEAYMYGRDPTWEELERTRRQYAERPSPIPETSVSPPQPPAAPAEPAPMVADQLSGTAERIATSLPTPPQPRTDPPGRSDSTALTTLEQAEAGPTNDVPYLPLDIGLDVELDLAGATDSTDEAKEEVAETRETSPPLLPVTADEEVAETRETSPPLPLVAADEDEPAHVTSFLDVLGSALPGSGPAAPAAQVVEAVADPDDGPAPITLESPREEWDRPLAEPTVDTRDTQAPVITQSDGGSGALDESADPTEPEPPLDEVHRGGLVLFYPVDDAPAASPPAPDEPEQADTAASASAPVAAAGKLFEPVSRQPSVTDAAPPSQVNAVVEHPGSESPAEAARQPAGENEQPKDVPSEVPSWKDESWESPADPPIPVPPALPIPASPAPKKVFARADLVLTADVATIAAHVDPDVFRPWWFRPGVRRVVLAAAAVVVVGVIATTFMRHRARPAVAAAVDADSSGSDGATPPGSATSDAGSDTIAPSPAPESRGGAAATDSTANVGSRQDSVSAPLAQPEPAVASEAANRSSEDGLARPVGPGSVSPIQPSGSGRSPAHR
jgi:hypothetical protein